MEIHIDNDADTIRAGSTVTGHVHLYPTMAVPPGSTIHVVFDGKEQCEIVYDPRGASDFAAPGFSSGGFDDYRLYAFGYDYDDVYPKVLMQNHSLVRLNTTCMSGRRFSIDIPDDLPSSMFASDGGSSCGITYTLRAYLPNSNIISVPKPIRVASKCEQVDSTLIVTVGDVVPLVKSQFCGLWETPFTTYTLATSPKSVTINPGQTLSMQLVDPKEVLPTTRLDVKLNQRICWTAQGCSHRVASYGHCQSPTRERLPFQHDSTNPPRAILSKSTLNCLHHSTTTTDKLWPVPHQ